MVRRKTAPVIDAKMYAHFAVITLLVTGAVALITDTEGAGTEVAGRMDEGEAAVAHAGSAIREEGEKTLSIGKDTETGSSTWEDDGGGGGGSGGGSGVGYYPGEASRSVSNAEAARRLRDLGIDPAQLARMSQKDREALLAQLGAHDGGAADSLNRAGGAEQENGNDY